MSRKNDFVDYIVTDLLSGMDGVEARAMFGEHCLYRDGKIFALVCDDTVYFKVDKRNRKKYEDAGSHQYTYQSGGKNVTMPYWEVPVEVLEDRDEIVRWAEESLSIPLKKS